MYKKVIGIILVAMIMFTCGVVTAKALSAPEKVEQTGIIGAEYIDELMEIDERWNEDGIELTYNIEISHVEDYWLVYLEGWADEYYGYDAVGIYDHMPTEEEIDILWNNRMDYDELSDLLEKYGL